MNTEKTQSLYTHAKERMPGGVQLLSKRPEMFAPDKWPAYASSAKGCKVTDLDGNTYYDVTLSGIGACLLGYADPDVTAAVVKRIENGSMSTLNAPEEVYLADRLCEIHPWAEQARFARTGGEICAVAVRIARATTGRNLVAISGYHGWSDWYLAANLADDSALNGQLLPGLKPKGVPQQLSGTTFTFFGNDKESFDQMIEEHGDELACVVMEPLRGVEPEEGFLAHIRDTLHKKGALLIFDEITIGWRYTFGGSHRALGVNPDMAVFAKALGNGHPIAAVIGTKAAMEKTRVWEHAAKVGLRVQDDWKAAADCHGIKVHTSGVACLPHFDFEEYPLPLKTLYTVLMLDEGFLANTAIYPTLAHDDEVLDKYRAAMDKVFCKIAEILKKGGEEAVLEAIDGKVCQTGFKRLLK